MATILNGLRDNIVGDRSIPKLLAGILAGSINSVAIDFETDLDDMTDAHAAMDERRAVKSLVRVSAIA